MGLSGFLGYRVDISRNFRLVGPSGFFRFWFGVKVVNYKMFLFVMEGSK